MDREATPTPAPAAWRSLLLAQAAAHARAGELALAETCAAAAVEADARDAEAQCLLGKIQAQREAPDRARASLRAALAAEPTHAAARSALECLDADGLRRHRRMLGVLATLAVAAVVLVAGRWAWWPRERTPVAAMQADAAPPPAASGPTGPARAGADTPLPAAQIERFAAYVAGLERLAAQAQVQVQAHAVTGPAGLGARLSGTVPTEHVRQQLRAHAATFTPMSVEDAAVELQPRYTVRRGDSLSSVAGRLYGHPEQWPRLRDANAASVGDGQRIEVGTVLVVP